MVTNLFRSVGRFSWMATTIFLLFLSNVQAQTTFPVIVREGLTNGQITMTYTPIDEASIENVFNGHLNDWARSAGINPMVVTLQFSYEFTITETSAYSHYNESGVWSVESANTLADLNGQTATYQKLVNVASYVPYTVASRPVNAKGRVLRLTMQRQTGDNYVHLSEWGITATGTLPTTCAHKGLPWELWISKVQFNTINNTSEKFKDYATVGFSDYTNLLTTVNKSRTYPLSITPGLSWSGILPNAYCRAWIDFNGNNTFEPTEMVFQNTNTNPFSGNVTIPSTAISGNVKMRIAMKGGSYADPCETFDKGEVEDYTIQITEGGQTILPDLTMANLNISTLSIQQGQALYYAIDVKNIGSAAAPGNFTFKAYISTDNVLSANDVQAGVYTLSNYAAGYTVTQVPGGYAIPQTFPIGQYYLILKIDGDNQIAENNENNNVFASVTTFTVAAAQSSYCIPTVSTIDNQWIEQVSTTSVIGQYYYNATSREGYGDFTSQQGPTIQRGQAASVTISPKSNVPNNTNNPYMFWRVWIDLNNDKDFNDAGEMVISSPVQIQSGVLVNNTMSFIVPITANLGKTRMRIALKAFAHATPCENMNVGEVEDYSITIGERIGGSCRYQDSLQLVSLYNASNPATWTNKWNLNTPIHTWYGVTLNSDGCVIGVDLQNNTIVGTLPNLNMPNLEFLGLRNNVFSGTIPNLNCPKLTTLLLAANKFTGTIPNFNCPNMQFLYLYGNQLTGTIPTFNYPNLRQLLLDGNQLMGTIPPMNFPLMNHLALSYNRLTGSIPDFNFPVIDKLFLDNNLLSGCIPVSFNAFCGKNVSIANNSGLATQDFNAFCSNNTGSCTPPNLPDLTLANLTIPTPSVQQGQTLNFKIDIKNIGTASATGSFNVKAYISTDNVLSANDVQDGIIPTGNFVAGFMVTQVPGASTIPASLAVGQYYLILKVDADNQITENNEYNNVIVSTTPFTVTTGQTGGAYCASKGTAPWELWISNVQFDSINNTSDKFKDFNTLGYSNYTNLSTTIPINRPYRLTVTPSLSWVGNLQNVYCRVWIDYNGNNTFETTEMVLQGSNMTSFSSMITIPSGDNSSVRMRVSVKWGGYPEPCEEFARGEVEDYTINIRGISVKWINVAVQNWSVPQAATIGQAQNSTFDITSNGTIPISNVSVGAFLSADNILGTDDLLVGSMTSPAIGIQTLTGLALPFTIPANTTSGNYFIILKADYTNQLTEIDEADNIIIKPIIIVQTNTSNYCTSKGTTPWEQWISGVTVFTNVVVTAFPPTVKEGYGNFSNGTAAVAQRGSGGLISIYPQSSWGADPRNANMFWRVWMDFNHDNDFNDAGEMVVSRTVGITSSGIFFDNDNGFSVPTTAMLGRTRMRVSMKVGGYPTPCETFERGEVEDYAINIIDGLSANQALIEFGNLKVQLIDATVRLDWVKLSDNIAGFEVEKSLDGKAFQLLEKVIMTPFNTYYYAYDAQPTEGGNFYRLKMTLNNGEVAYSNVQKVLYQKLADFTLFPNPTREEIFVDLKAFENRTIDLYISNLIGQEVAHQTIESVTRAPYRLDVSMLENGAYFIRVETKGRRAVVRKLEVMRF